MNISFNTQSPYSSFYQKGTLMGQNSQQKTAGSNSPFAPGKDASANPLSKFAKQGVWHQSRTPFIFAFTLVLWSIFRTLL